MVSRAGLASENSLARVTTCTIATISGSGEADRIEKPRMIAAPGISSAGAMPKRDISARVTSSCTTRVSELTARSRVEKNAARSSAVAKAVRAMRFCSLYSSVPTPTPSTTISAIQRSSGSRTTSFRPASTSPPIGFSPLAWPRPASRATAYRRRRRMHTMHRVSRPAETSIMLGMPTCSTRVRVSTGPTKAPIVPAAPMKP